MKHSVLFSTIIWDLKLIVKYNIATIAFSITAIYVLIFFIFDMQGLEKITAILIFSDPVMYGYLFISVMILFEKDAGTLRAIAITPLTTRRYILSKGVAFTVLAMVTSTIMLVSSRPLHINYLYFFLAVIFSSFLFVFIGIISISRVNNFNQFIVIIPIVLAPVCLPFLNYFNITESIWLYVIPTQACLVLFEASVSSIDNWKIIYAILYLIFWIYLTYLYAIRFYNRFIIHTDRHE